jgi:DNA mismatch endonuclease, patch repair protein
MADVLTPEERSACMRAVRGQDTTPEMRVRRTAHYMGYRYALHKKNLPGSPDLVFPARKKIIFVHGCFWHMHDCKAGRKIPASNTEYWTAKRARNAERDRESIAALTSQGWKVLLVWECETKDLVNLRARISAFLES